MLFAINAPYFLLRRANCYRRQKVAVDNKCAGCPWKEGRHCCPLDLKNALVIFHGMFSCKTDNEDVLLTCLTVYTAKL